MTEEEELSFYKDLLSYILSGMIKDFTYVGILHESMEILHKLLLVASPEKRAQAWYSALHETCSELEKESPVRN